MARSPKIAQVTQRAYGRAYARFVDLAVRQVKAFVRKRRTQIVNKFYKIARKTFKKSMDGEIVKAELAAAREKNPECSCGDQECRHVTHYLTVYKASFDQEWIDAVASDLGGELALSPVSIVLVEESAKAVLEAMGEELSLFPFGEVNAAYLEAHGLELATTVAESLKPVLLDAMAEGIALGENPMKIKERIREALADWEEHKLNRLARTEAMNAANEGALQAMKASGVFTHKEWFAHAGACPICAGLDGEVVPIDNVFSEGESRPPQHPNCRCTIGARRGKGKKTKPSPGVSAT